jgi:drug/metabolite transporter (DMT)-like permease
MLFGLAGALYAGPHLPDLQELVILLGIGVFGGLAQLAMTRSYSYGHTMLSANLSYATVVFASLFGALLWDEIMPWMSWIGIACIVASAIMISLRPRRSS